MHKADAYATLARELEAMRSLALPDLIALIGRPATVRTSMLGSEEIQIEIAAAWENSRRCTTRLCGSVRGASSWRHEILEESVLVTIEPG